MDEVAQDRRGWIRAPRDFWGGIVLILLAAFVLWSTSNLAGMRGFQFGPGTAPWLFALLLLALGLGVTFMGFRPGPALDSYYLRGSLFVTAAVVLFALAIRPLGLIATTLLCYFIAALANPVRSWRSMVLVGIGFTAFCSVLFPYVLNLPFLMLPTFLR